jgi:F0F1-type ATP synthase membrane subunit b/b'
LEIRKARWIVSERDELLAQARQQAAEIIDEARRQARGGSTQP